MRKTSTFSQQATNYLKDLGGASNVDSIINCASRIRVTVINEQLVANNNKFIADGAVNVVRHHQAIQIIVGLDVPQILSIMRQLLAGLEIHDTELDEYGLTPVGEKATILYECFGLDGNIQQITVNNEQIIVQVKDISWVDPFDIMLQLGIGIKSVRIDGNRIFVDIEEATAVARHMLMMNMYKAKGFIHDDTN